MTAVKLRLAQAAMGKLETSIAELCAELEVARQTLYRDLTPTDELRAKRCSWQNASAGRTFTGPHARGSPDRIGERGHNAYD